MSRHPARGATASAKLVTLRTGAPSMLDPTTRPLHGQVALVTGAARGIGRAIAHKLASEGADVAINYYNSHEQAEALCGEVRALGGRAIAIQGSVGVPDSVDEIFAA